jgi:hypothetical protein
MRLSGFCFQILVGGQALVGAIPLAAIAVFNCSANSRLEVILVFPDERHAWVPDKGPRGALLPESLWRLPARAAQLSANAAVRSNLRATTRAVNIVCLIFVPENGEQSAPRLFRASQRKAEYSRSIAASRVNFSSFACMRPMVARDSDEHISLGRPLTLGAGGAKPTSPHRNFRFSAGNRLKRLSYARGLGIRVMH